MPDPRQDPLAPSASVQSIGSQAMPSVTSGTQSAVREQYGAPGEPAPRRENKAMWSAAYYLSDRGRRELDPETEAFFVREGHGVRPKEYTPAEKKVAARAFFQLSQGGKQQLPSEWEFELRRILNSGGKQAGRPPGVEVEIGQAKIEKPPARRSAPAPEPAPKPDAGLTDSGPTADEAEAAHRQATADLFNELRNAGVGGDEAVELATKISAARRAKAAMAARPSDEDLPRR